MKKILMMAVLALSLSACTDPDNATKVLENNGYTDIQMTGYSWFGCSEDDFFHTGFKAHSPANKTVEGAVCSGMFFKNSTIRFD